MGQTARDIKRDSKRVSKRQRGYRETERELQLQRD